MHPKGYVILQRAIRLDRPVQAYHRWMEKIPAVYRESVQGKEASNKVPKVENDENCFALLKHYRSLMPLAMEAHKPMFFLKPADGAIGAHLHAAQSCYADFRNLAFKIAEKCGLEIEY